MVRPLTARERDVLLAMIACGTVSETGGSVAAADRERWADQVPTVLVHGSCGCGACPSIDLAPGDGGARPTPTRQTVLEASTADAFLLLFIEDDRPTYLELAPFGDDPIVDFPLVADVTF